MSELFYKLDIPKESIAKYKQIALVYLKNVTLNRIVGHENDDDVRLCLGKLAEAFYKFNLRSGIKSENNDGYSVVFDDTDINKCGLDIVKAFVPHFMYSGMHVIGD